MLSWFFFLLRNYSLLGQFNDFVSLSGRDCKTSTVSVNVLRSSRDASSLNDFISSGSRTLTLRDDFFNIERETYRELYFLQLLYSSCR